MMSETQDIQGILEKRYTKGSFSQFKEGPCHYRTNQLEVWQDEIMRTKLSSKWNTPSTINGGKNQLSIDRTKLQEIS